MKVNRRRFIAGCFTAAIATSGSAGAYGLLIAPNHLVIERRQIKLPQLAGLRLVVMSDFHLEPFTKLPLIEHAVEMANALQPDLILLPGDFITGDAEPIHDLAPALGKLRASLGVFATLGDHDCWHQPKLVADALRQAGIPVFENGGVALRYNQQDFFLAGLKSMFARGEPSVVAAMEARRSRLPTILMMHEPDFADSVAITQQVDLQLSGHTHGGQVRLPGLAPFWLPGGGRRYIMGHFQIDDLQLYTSRGVGMSGVPLRFFCPPEITEITLI